MRALIVEYEPLLNEELQEQLLDEKFNVDSTKTLSEGQEWVTSDEYDLVQFSKNQMAPLSISLRVQKMCPLLGKTFV